MTIQRQILAATDGSVAASHAVTRARDISAHTGSHLHVYQSEANDAANDVLQQADATSADLIVVGASGAGGATRFMSTTVSAKVLRASRRPVLIVRSASTDSYRRALVLIDFTPASTTALAAARWMAPGARLVLVHALGLTKDPSGDKTGYRDPVLERHHENLRSNAQKRLDELARRCQLPASDFECVVTDHSVIEAIDTVIEDRSVDLIVTGKHGRGRLVELILGSVTREVLSRTMSDTLVVTDERTEI